MTQTKFVRMKMSTYHKLRHKFKAERGESASSYFDRLARWINERI